MNPLFSPSRKTGMGIALIITAVMAFCVLVIGILAVRSAWTTMRLSNICPDYFSQYQAFVVGPDGQGLDSVAVMMRDNTNTNLIYRTFTDSTGRFELFNDFYSFTLFNGPAAFHLYVSFGAHTDTMLYKFQLHRICHFRKVDGPDTIRFTPRTGALTLQMENPQQVAILDKCAYAPWETLAMGPVVPAALNSALKGFESVSYGLLPMGNRRMVIASATRLPRAEKTGASPVDGYGRPLSSSASYYVLDRDLDGDLNDETLYPWSGPGNDASGECAVRLCEVTETVVSDGKALRFGLAARGVDRPSFGLRFRALDAVQGTVTVGTTSYRILLWDRAMAGFTDLRSVAIGLDRDFDGKIACAEGSCELFETALRRIRLDTLSFLIDTITIGTYSIRCKDVRQDSSACRSASPGDPLTEFRATYQSPWSLWKECGSHSFVALYFFEGNSASHMESPEIAAMLTVMRKRLGTTKLVGVNRAPIGPAYTDGVVILENKGWEGPLVTLARNHREREILCIDSLGEIVSRAAPGRETIEELWDRLKRRDLPAALGQYEALLGSATLLGKAGYE